MLFSFVQKYSEKKGFQGNIFVLQVIFFPVKMSEEILKLLKQLRKKELVFRRNVFTKNFQRNVSGYTKKKNGFFISFSFESTEKKVHLVSHLKMFFF